MDSHLLSREVIYHLDLARFRGHRTVCVQGVHDDKDTIALAGWWNWCTPAVRWRSWRRRLRTLGSSSNPLYAREAQPIRREPEALRSLEESEPRLMASSAFRTVRADRALIRALRRYVRRLEREMEEGDSGRGSCPMAAARPADVAEHVAGARSASSNSPGVASRRADGQPSRSARWVNVCHSLATGADAVPPTARAARWLSLGSRRWLLTYLDRSAASRCRNGGLHCRARRLARAGGPPPQPSVSLL
jgi:hypothetical protein